jgi:MFS family permease
MARRQSPKKLHKSSGQGLNLPTTFKALRHRNYLVWFIGQTVSLVGTWMQNIAQQVLVYRITGSAAALGMISFIGLIPLIPMTLWGGSISDRAPKRTIILICQVLMLLQALILAVLCWSGTVQLWEIYLLSFFLSAVSSVDLTARQAFTVEMVEGKEDLTNAIGLNSAMFNGARALGPALAGLLIAATGEGWAFFINGLSFVAVIISLLLMRNLPQMHTQSPSASSLFTHLMEGYRYTIKQQAILVLTSLVGVSAFLSMPYSTLAPVFANVVLKHSAQPVVNFLCGGESPIIHCQSPDALPLGLLMTMVGMGAVIGALFVASLSDTTSRGFLLTVGNLTFPLFLLLFAFSRSFIFSLLMMMMVGSSFVLQNSLANTLLQLICPDEMRGRVMSLYTLIFQGMMRLGGLQAGYMSDWIGAPLSVALGAVVSLVYGLFVAVRYPKFRKM